MSGAWAGGAAPGAGRALLAVSSPGLPFPGRVGPYRAAGSLWAGSSPVVLWLFRFVRSLPASAGALRGAAGGLCSLAGGSGAWARRAAGGGWAGEHRPAAAVLASGGSRRRDGKRGLWSELRETLPLIFCVDGTNVLSEELWGVSKCQNCTWCCKIFQCVFAVGSEGRYCKTLEQITVLDSIVSFQFYVLKSKLSYLGEKNLNFMISGRVKRL